MKRNAPLSRVVAVLALALLATMAIAAPVKLTPEQEQAASKLKAKGAAVVQIANDTDALSVNLALAGKQATDEDLAQIKLLPKVTQLNVAGTGVTDAGLANVAGLAGLTHLHLNGTAVTDAGLTHLKGLTNLVYLNLYSTGVTDKGVESLKGLKNLKKLYLWQTKVTDAGAKSIKDAIPGIYVNRGEEMAALAEVKPPPPPTPATPAAKPVNAQCPVADKPVDASFTVQHEGKTIGFCCDKCPETFKKDPKKYAGKIVVVAAPAAVAKPDDKKPAAEEGYVRSWLILAPIPLGDATGAEGIDNQQLADEGALKPKAGDKAKAGDKELVWKKVDTKENHFDINEILGEQTDMAVAYAVVYVDAAEEMKDVQLAMGSNDQGKAYLNGKEVVKFTEGRTLEPDSDVAEKLTLNKGTNVVVLKVINEANNFQGCIRFRDSAGKPITKLKFKTAQ